MLLEDFVPGVEEEPSGNNLLKWALLVTVVLAGALVARYFLAKRATGGGIAPKSAIKYGAGNHRKDRLPRI